MDSTLYTSVINQFKALLVSRNKNVNEYFFSENTNLEFIDVKYQCQDMFSIYICKFIPEDILTNNLRWKKYKTSLLNAAHYYCLREATSNSTQVINSNLVATIQSMKENYDLDEDTLLALEKNIIGFATPHVSSYSRPIKLGVSGGNGSDTLRDASCCSAGTLGCLVENSGTKYILSNSHVFVNHEPTIRNDSDATRVGDRVTQPGPLDYGCNSGLAASNTVGTLTAWTPLFSGATPPVDIALAKIVDNQVDTTGEILGLGHIKEVNSNTAISPSINLNVQKSGRTTGLTHSNITVIGATINVGYNSCNGSTFTITYNNCFIVDSPNNSFGAAGDSGSLICKYDPNNSSLPEPVGLLFAGNSSIIIGLPIKNVLSTIDDLLGTSVGTTKTVTLNDSTPTPNPGNSCQLANSTVELEAASLVMLSNSDFLDTIPCIVVKGLTCNNNNNACIVVMVSNDDYLQMDIPDNLEGVPLDIVNIGEPITAMI